MARRTVKRPFITVVVVAHNAEHHIVRTLESVLDQGFDDVQLVVADCASDDGTASICRRAAERDIRLDVIELEDSDAPAAFDRALEEARAPYILPLGQNDWLAPHALSSLYDALHDGSWQLALLSLSVDQDFDTGERSSHLLSFEVSPARTEDEVHDQAALFIADGLLTSVRGKVLDRDRSERLGLRMSLCGDEAAYLASYLEDVSRACVVNEAVCHVAQRNPIEDFDMELYRQCERNHARFLQLLASWHREQDDALVTAVHRLHLRELITCIEGVCALKGISTIERNALVRDMIDASSTRGSVAVLGDASRELGFMYGPIARGSVMACCLSARFASLARVSHLPFAMRMGVSLSYA